MLRLLKKQFHTSIPQSCGLWGVSGSRSQSFDLPVCPEKHGIAKRGPDSTRMHLYSNNLYKYICGFDRLEIMGTQSYLGDQPFVHTSAHVQEWISCNGEIYNYQELANTRNIPLSRSDSDCSIIHNLIQRVGILESVKALHGEFALAYVRATRQTLTTYLCRDPFGVRPLFYAVDENQNTVYYSSLAKGWTHLPIRQVPPGTLVEIVQYMDPTGSFQNSLKPTIIKTKTFDIGTIQTNHRLYDTVMYDTIQRSLVRAVERRMMSHRPLGALLSGGLDSSLVVSIASALYAKRTGQKMKTFSVGLPGSTDKTYAKLVSQHCDTVHTHVEFTETEFIKAIPKVIHCIESYDVTTIRASVGQYLLSEYIRNHTNIKVLLIGDGSDEVTGGYLYFHNAPSATEFHAECVRLLKNIHFFDGLRADRCISHFGLEARVPFLDKDFVTTYLSIPAQYRSIGNRVKCAEKYALRKAFDTVNPVTNDNYLPKQVLWRQKEAFSDGVSSTTRSWHSVIQKQLDTEKYKDEKAMYLDLFTKTFGMHNLSIIPHYWMPRWCDPSVTDPSARTLPQYG